STRAGVARPVRTLENSDCVWATAFPIFSVVSRRTSSIMADPAPESSDKRTDRLPLEGASDVPRLHHVEHDDGQAVVHAERDGGGIHDLETQLEHFDVFQLAELGGRRVDEGIVRVDAVHTRVRALEDGLGADLGPSQGSGGIGREVRVPGTAGEYAHPTLL